MTSQSRRRVVLLAAVGFATLTACASQWSGSDYYGKALQVDEPERQIAGEILEQRKSQMRRAQWDLTHIRDTAISIRRHKSLDDLSLFAGFVHPYLETHLESLITRQSDAWHPDLRPLEANLLFAKGDVLVELRDWRRVDRVVSEIEELFDGMDNMPVQYPIGNQTTLGSALTVLRDSRYHL